MSWRHHHPTNPNDANADRIKAADQGPGRRQRPLMRVLEMIETYIRDQAWRYGGDIERVPCPDEKAWAALTQGRSPKLPNESQLRLYARRKMHDLASTKEGGLREAYFEVARLYVRKPDLKQPRT